MIESGDPIAALSQTLQLARELEDLKAQMEMAFWAKAMFWATVGSLVLSSLAAMAAFASFFQAQKATKLSREVGEFQTQAYVHAERAAFGLRQNVLIYCKNGGVTPATHFCVNAKAQLVDRNQVTASISFHDDGYKVWTTLAAGEERAASVLEDDPIVSAFDQSPNINQRLLITGQILYCSIFNHDHVTQFAFFVEPYGRRFFKPTANMVTFQRTDAPHLSKDAVITMDDSRELEPPQTS